MGIASGLGGQLMIAEESTWASPATVTRAYTFNDETLGLQKKSVQGLGLQAGGFVNQGALRADTATWVGGDIDLDVVSKGMGLWFKHMFGASTITQQGATAAWKQSHNLGTSVNGKGLTVQVGRPTTDGTSNPITYSGCKVTAWQLAAAATDILKMKVSVIGQARTTATALATPSYLANSNIFHFKQAAITVGGNPYIAVRDFTAAGDNGLAPDRFYMGNNGQIAEPIRKDFTKLTGSFTADHVDTTMSANYIADNELAIVLTFVGAQIATAQFETITLTSNGIRLNGAEAMISGPDILNNAITFDNLLPKGGGTQVQLDYISLDTAI